MVVVQPSKQDEGYAWVILVATFSLKVLEDGLQLSGGVLFVEFIAQFNKSRAETAWVGSIMLGVLNLSGPVAAIIVNKIGCRECAMLGSVTVCLAYVVSYFVPSLHYMYITLGVMQGFGLGLLQLGGTVGAGKYFKKKRALALGITYCGGGIGLFIFAPVIQRLIETYSMRGAMLIIAGIALNCCVFAAFLRPFVEAVDTENSKDPESKVLLETNKAGETETPSPEADNRDGEDCGQNEQMIPDSNNETIAQNDDNDSGNSVYNNTFKNSFIESVVPKAMVTNVNFIILMVATVFIAMPEYVPFSMLPDFSLTVGCTASQSAWIVSVIGIGSTTSNIIGGWLSDMSCVNSALLLTISVLGVGISTMVIAVVPMLETFFAYSVLFGACVGTMYLLQPVVLFENIGEKYMASTMGMLMWVYGVANFVGTPLAGWIFDQRGSYRVSFLVAGASFVLSAAITSLVFCSKKPTREESKKKSEGVV